MTTYRARVPLGSTASAVVSAIHEVGKIVEIYDDAVVIHLEANDEYNLAETVHSLRDAVAGATGEYISVLRPTPVSDAEPVHSASEVIEQGREDERLTDAKALLRDMSSHELDREQQEFYSMLRSIVDYAEERLRINLGLQQVNAALKKRLDAPQESTR